MYQNSDVSISEQKSNNYIFGVVNTGCLILTAKGSTTSHCGYIIQSSAKNNNLTSSMPVPKSNHDYRQWSSALGLDQC